MKVENQIGNDPSSDATDEQGGHENEGRQRLSGRPAVSLLAAILLVVQLGLIFAGSTVAADIDSSKEYLWPPSKRSSYTEWVLVVITFTYVVATVIYIVIAGRQLGETKRSNDRMFNEIKRANSLTLRAWVLVPSVDLSPNPDAQNERMVLVNVHNAGKLPATSVSIAIEPRVGRSAIPGFTVSPGLDPEGVVIAPEERPVFRFIITAESEDHMRSILAGDFNVIARVEYTDPIETQGAKTAQCFIYLSGTPTLLARFERVPVDSYIL